MKNKIVKILLRPLQGGGSFFLFMYALLLMVLGPVWFLTPTGAKVDLWSFVEGFADLYILAWAISYLPRRIRHLVQGLCAGTLLVFSIVDFFVKLHFQTFINAAMLRLVLETRGNEVSNFFTSYVLQPTTLLLLLPFILWGAAWYGYVKYYPRIAPLLRRIPKLAVAGIVVLSLLIGEVGLLPVKLRTFRMMNAETLSDMEVLYGDPPTHSLYSSVHRFFFSLRSIQLVKHQIVGVRQLHEEMTAEKEEKAVPKVVVIIGESFNRAHSQLYGYHLPTTPHQLERAQKGELHAFTDVVSCWNLTSYVFQNLMSLHSVDSKDAWENYPLFPAIYKKAGYRVSFLSNQFPARVAGSISAFSGSFFMNDPVLGKQLFDYHNADLIEPVDDAYLLPEYQRIKERAPYELVIFSLIGMHFNYDQRIPSDEWKYFDEKRYLSKNLKTEDRQIIADYDNAVRYNDAIIEDILRYFEKENALVLYCPDHGEELFDGTGVWGRTYPEVLSEAEMHNQFEIPFWIWCSPTFSATYPEKVEQLKAALDRPFMTDDLPHLLLPLTGVHSEYYDATRDLLSPKYNAKRKRILRGWQEFH